MIRDTYLTKGLSISIFDAQFSRKIHAPNLLVSPAGVYALSIIISIINFLISGFSNLNVSCVRSPLARPLCKLC